MTQYVRGMTQVTAVRGFRQWPACPPRHDEAANHADSASRAARQLGSMPRDSNPTAAAGWAGPGVKPNAASSVRRRFMTTRPPGVSRCNTLGYWGVRAARRGTGSRHVTFPLQVPRGSSIQRPPGRRSGPPAVTWLTLHQRTSRNSGRLGAAPVGSAGPLAATVWLAERLCWSLPFAGAVVGVYVDLRRLRRRVTSGKAPSV
jgi:hypothetical protein